MRISKLKLLILVAMSAVGLWASGTVLVIYYTLGQQLPLCPTGSYFGIHLDCGAVLGSGYSKVFGVPLELLAVLYFVVNLVLVYLIAFGSDRVAKRSLSVLFGWRFIGLAMVPYLVFVEFFLLHAVCVYCTIMHIAILVDFAVISYVLFFGKGALWGADESDTTTEAPPQPLGERNPGAL